MTERQEQAQKLRAEGKTFREVAAVMGITPQRAWQLIHADRQAAMHKHWRMNKGVRPMAEVIANAHWPGRIRSGRGRGRPKGGKNHRWTAEDDALFASLSVREIASRLGVSLCSANIRRIKLRREARKQRLPE